MAFKTKLNLSNSKFEQTTGTTLHLSGTTISYGSIQYGGDYSGGFDDRSLVDRGWVLSVATGSSENITASNGITKTGNNFSLGGEITGTTYFDANSNSITWDKLFNITHNLSGATATYNL